MNFKYRMEMGYESAGRARARAWGAFEIHTETRRLDSGWIRTGARRETDGRRVRVPERRREGEERRIAGREGSHAHRQRGARGSLEDRELRRYLFGTLWARQTGSKLGRNGGGGRMRVLGEDDGEGSEDGGRKNGGRKGKEGQEERGRGRKGRMDSSPCGKESKKIVKPCPVGRIQPFRKTSKMSTYAFLAFGRAIEALQTERTDAECSDVARAQLQHPYRSAEGTKSGQRLRGALGSTSRSSVVDVWRILAQKPSYFSASTAVQDLHLVTDFWRERRMRKRRRVGFTLAIFPRALEGASANLEMLSTTRRYAGGGKALRPGKEKKGPSAPQCITKWNEFNELQKDRMNARTIPKHTHSQLQKASFSSKKTKVKADKGKRVPKDGSSMIYVENKCGKRLLLAPIAFAHRLCSLPFAAV
ncbi:hypothetical protein C8R45DRAFT_1124534 [Mycena sanguinolenta]|nr:hypothetical protein C8R45DRAFT_1124534 [Mycena sanguinolenta]